MVRRMDDKIQRTDNRDVPLDKYCGALIVGLDVQYGRISLHAEILIPLTTVKSDDCKAWF